MNTSESGNKAKKVAGADSVKSAKKAYTRDGRWIWSETNYSGEIVSETATEVIVKYFYNPRSGIGYEQYHIRKDDIDEAKA